MGVGSWKSGLGVDKIFFPSRCHSAPSSPSCFFPAQAPRSDVVVYGGTSAGVIAAVQAKKMGKTVVIVGPDKHLGGLSSGGLGFTDTGNKAVIGGLSRDFYHRVWTALRAAGRLEVAEAVRSTATKGRARRRSTASSARCGSSSRTWPSRSSRTTCSEYRHPRRARRMARPREGREEGRRAHHVDHDAERQDLRREDVHRCDLRGRSDGGGGRGVSRRPRGEQRLRREVERRADRRAASPASLRRGEAEDQPLRRAGRSEERRAAAHQRGAAGRVRRGRQARAGLLLPHVPHRPPGEPHPVPEARGLRPEAIRAARCASSTPAGARRSRSSIRSRITRPTRTTTGRSAPTTSA